MAAMAVADERAQAHGPSAVVWGLLCLAVAVAAWLRLQGIDRSLGHDEVFTWVTFASKPWSVISSSYEAPNNHIFHTLCVKLSAALFGQSDWAIRLPAATAGIALVPATFLLARALTGSASTALVAALLSALCQGQVSASIQARGYSLLALTGSMHALCTIQALGEGRRLLWWSGCAAFGFLAVLTVPSGIYLVVAVLVWAGARLLWARRRSRDAGDRSATSAWPFLTATAALVVLVAAVYLPLLEQLALQSRQWGISLDGNPGLLLDVWLGVLEQAGPWSWPLVGLALGLLGMAAMAIERRSSLALIPAILTLPFALNLLMGVAGPSRVYVFATPFLLLLVARGVTALPELVSRLWPAWGEAASGRAVALAVVAVAALASYFAPPTLDGPSDTRYRQLGEIIVDETDSGDLLVAPYIMDNSIGYYTDDLLVKRVRETAVDGRLDRVFLVARAGDVARYSLGDYMLTTNFTTAEAGHSDRYRKFELPAGAFRVVGETGELRLFESVGAPQEVTGGGGEWGTDAWRIYYESHPGTTRLAGGTVPGDPDDLVLTGAEKGTFVLHSVFRYRPDRMGLLLLAYTKSAAEGSYASLYQAGSASGSEDLWAVQMAKPLSQTVELEGPVERAVAELYLVPVQQSRYYGVYIFSRGQSRHSFGDFALYFLPY